MADIVLHGKSSLGPEDVIVRAVQFFSTKNWRPTSQSARAATFQGKPAIPWFMLLLTFLAFLACIVPGVIMYIMVIRKVYRFCNLVVTASPISGGSEVVIQYPKSAAKLASRFHEALPPLRPAGQAAYAPLPNLTSPASEPRPLSATYAVTSMSATAEPAPAAQRAAQFCGDCGAKVEPGSRFCESCGAPQ